MNWNPFKRIAELEKMHAQNIAVLSALTDKVNDLSNKLKQQNHVIYRDDQTRPDTPVSLTATDVEKEAKRRLQRAAYARKYYAKKRAAKAAEGGAK